MDRKALSYAVSQRLSEKEINISAKLVDKVISTMWQVIFDELERWNDISIYNFATFSVTQRKSRSWINPRTFTPVIVPAHKTIRVKMSNIIKKRINWK